MSNPFEILAVASSADDEAIKNAYLAKVREFPPDHYPERFQAVREAYEALKDEKSRLAYDLFHVEVPDVTLLWHELVDQPYIDHQPIARRPSLASFRQLVKASAVHYQPVGNAKPGDR